jgi:hypothetical protein
MMILRLLGLSVFVLALVLTAAGCGGGEGDKPKGQGADPRIKRAGTQGAAKAKMTPQGE